MSHLRASGVQTNWKFRSCSCANPLRPLSLSQHSRPLTHQNTAENEDDDPAPAPAPALDRRTERAERDPPRTAHWDVKATNYAVLGTLRFAHLPSYSFLSLLPPEDDLETVREFRDHVEVSLRAQKMFEELSAEREVLAKAVASLNMVRRKGKPNVSLLNVEEDDDDV
ncbi:hypothetical protein B0H11DRAFT_2232137 [Mycena galericulata]|nr:hypothetical protein B0H11DRAFT_2232137 [Mycena galericulata]